MRYRKLRIAWSVGCGVVAALLCVLWMRSYWSKDLLSGHIANRWFVFESVEGHVAYRSQDNAGGIRMTWGIDSWVRTSRWFGVRMNYDLLLQYWSLTFACAVLAAMPWLDRCARYCVDLKTIHN